MGTGTSPSPGGGVPWAAALGASVNLVPLLWTGVRHHPPGVRAASPLKMGLISLETMYLVMYCHSFDVSFMYLKCISSVVFGASGRLVSLCIVYVSCRA